MAAFAGTITAVTTKRVSEFMIEKKSKVKIVTGSHQVLRVTMETDSADIPELEQLLGEMLKQGVRASVVLEQESLPRE